MAVLPSQMPISSDSSTPTMATFLDRDNGRFAF
jgi:hypothetical protein